MSATVMVVVEVVYMLKKCIRIDEKEKKRYLGSRRNCVLSPLWSVVAVECHGNGRHLFVKKMSLV